jgi:hypothetical protein
VSQFILAYFADRPPAYLDEVVLAC